MQALALTRAARPWYVASAAGVLVFALGFVVAPLDDDAAPALLGEPALVGAATVLAFVHTFAFLAPLLLILLLALAAMRRWWGALRLGAVVGTADLSNDVLKALIAKPRPEYAIVDAHGYAFPSGHATMGAALAVLLVWFAVRNLQGRAPVLLALGAAVGWALAQALGRLVLGVHSLSDVVSGIGLGVAVAGLVLAVSLYVERLAAERVGLAVTRRRGSP